jgi:hypothetical protein
VTAEYDDRAPDAERQPTSGRRLAHRFAGIAVASYLVGGVGWGVMPAAQAQLSDTEKVAVVSITAASDPTAGSHGAHRSKPNAHRRSIPKPRHTATTHSAATAPKTAPKAAAPKTAPKAKTGPHSKLTGTGTATDTGTPAAAATP